MATASHLTATAGNLPTYSFTWDGVTSHAVGKLEFARDGLPVNKRLYRKTYTLTTYTSAAQVGDVICATQSLASIAPDTDTTFAVYAATLQDKSDSIFGCELVFLRTNVTFGTAGSFPSITDTDGESEENSIYFSQASFVDRGGYKICKVSGLYLPVEPVSGTSNIYAAVRLTEVPSTDPTFSASDLILTLWCM